MFCGNKSERWVDKWSDFPIHEKIKISAPYQKIDYVGQYIFKGKVML